MTADIGAARNDRVGARSYGVLPGRTTLYCISSGEVGVRVA